ncbi:hypothetical protein GOB20_15985 [Sinorhizobium meliloti]|nr:hypothetical protein [Sinorhizobium meliloti]
MEPFEIERGLKGSYAIDKETLQRVFKELRDASEAESPAVTFKFANGRSAKGRDIEELFNESLINSVEVGAVYILSKRDNRTADIMLSQNSPPIALRISGERDWALGVEEKVLNHLQSSKTWYSVLNTESWPSININLVFPILALAVSLFFYAGTYLA